MKILNFCRMLFKVADNGRRIYAGAIKEPLSYCRLSRPCINTFVMCCQFKNQKVFFEIVVQIFVYIKTSF